MSSTPQKSEIQKSKREKKKSEKEKQGLPKFGEDQSSQVKTRATKNSKFKIEESEQITENKASKKSKAQITYVKKVGIPKKGIQSDIAGYFGGNKKHLKKRKLGGEESSQKSASDGSFTLADDNPEDDQSNAAELQAIFQSISNKSESPALAKNLVKQEPTGAMTIRPKIAQRSSNSGGGSKSTDENWFTDISPTGLTKNSYSAQLYYHSHFTNYFSDYLDKKKNLPLFQDFYYSISERFEKDPAFARKLWTDYFKKAIDYSKKGVDEHYFEEARKELFDEAKPEIFIEGLRLVKGLLVKSLSQPQLTSIYNQFVTEVFQKAKLGQNHFVKWRQLHKAHMKFVCQIIVNSDKFNELDEYQLDLFTVYSSHSQFNFQATQDFIDKCDSLKTAEQKFALIKAMFQMHDDLANACARNFDQVGTIDILNFISQALDQKQANIIKNLSHVGKKSKYLIEMLSSLKTLNLFELLNTSMTTKSVSIFDIYSVIDAAEKVSKKQEYSTFIGSVKDFSWHMDDLIEKLKDFAQSSGNLCSEATDKQVAKIIKQDQAISRKGQDALNPSKIQEDVVKSAHYSYYESQRKTLYGYQKYICGYLFELHNQYDKLVVQLGTGLGKSLCIGLLLRMLYDNHPDSKIFVVTKTLYLSYQLFSLHGEKEISYWNQDEPSEAQRIHFLTFQKLVQDYSDQDHTNNYFVIDEFEQLLLEENFKINDNESDKTLQFKYNGNFFDNIKLFGFTGSYSEVAEQLLLQNQKKNPSSKYHCIKFKDLSGQNPKVQKVFYYDQAKDKAEMPDRELQLTKLVNQSLAANQTVILIDDNFKGNSFLKAQVDKEIFEFYKFEDDWHTITMDLAQLTLHEGPCVVHTNLDGVRGADFKVKNDKVKVILAFRPQRSYEITQAIGRGMRGVNSTCQTAMLVDIAFQKQFNDIIQPHAFLLLKEANERQRDIMIIKTMKLLDKRLFQSTDPPSGIKLKQDARTGNEQENYITLLRSIFVEGNSLIYKDNTENFDEIGTDGLKISERWEWLQHLFKPFLDRAQPWLILNDDIEIKEEKINRKAVEVVTKKQK